MTDLQFKSIYESFYQLLERAKDIEDAKKAVRAILGKPEIEKEETKQSGG